MFYTMIQVGQCIIDSIKFEFNDIISMYTKNDSERWRYVSVDVLYIIIVNNNQSIIK